MLIGELAIAAGVSVETIRFYERRGVLPRAPRTASGYRVYSSEVLTRLQRIKHLQALGLTLEEILESLPIIDRGDVSCDSELWRLRLSLDRVEGKIGELCETREKIVLAMKQCLHKRCSLARS